MNLKRILIPFIFGVFAVSLSSYTQAQNCDPDTTIITSEKALMFYLEKPALKKPTNKPVSVIMNTNQWHYFVFTKASNREGKIYLDGVLKDSGTFRDLPYDYSKLLLGTSLYTSFGVFYEGLLDELRVSKVVRSASEIANHYNSGLPFSVDTNTFGLWHFDETSGTKFANSVGGSGDLFNGPVFTNGKFNNALYFDGVNDRGDCNVDIPEDNITIEFWAKLDSSISSNETIIQPYGIYSTNIGFNIITDTIITNATSYSTDTITACGSYTWTNGITYTSSNTSDQDTFINTIGCDSIVTLHLTVQNRTSKPLSLPDTLLVFHNDSIQIDAGSDYLRYNWSTGDTSRQIWVKNSGKIYLSITDSFSTCDEDTATFLFVHRIQQKDTTVCEETPIRLHISNTLNTSSFSLMVSKTSPALEWGPMDVLTNATSIDGDSNTQQIVDSLGDYNAGNYAANYCLQLEEEGYDDWYLPTVDEVSNLLCPNKELINDWISPGYYWSSSEESIRDASKLYSNTTPASSCKTVAAPFKTDQSIVRCVRKIAKINYVWSTNDSTSSIQVVPTSKTTYRCTQYIGNNAITDSVTITTLKKSFTTQNLIDCDSITSPTGKIYTSTGIYADTLKNAAGCDSVITSNVIIGDTTLPIILTRNDTIYLNSLGNASITAADINNGSSDNCGINTIQLSKSQFDCSNLGNNTTWLIVSDRYGNIDSASAQITVLDTIKPSLSTKDITIYLDAAGKASITVSDIDDGSFDNCSISNLALSQRSFDCSNSGLNLIQLFATDLQGNSQSANANVTVLDTIAPRVLSQPKNVELGYCDALFTYPDATIIENCNYTITQTSGLPSGSIFPAGITTNTFEVIDALGNKTVYFFEVDVREKYMPFALNDTSFCVNQNPANLSRNRNDVIFSGRGMNGDGITFNPSEAGIGNHTITVSFQDSMGCTTQDTLIIDIVDAPPIPTIERINSDLLKVAHEYENYQWYRNGVPINNEQTYYYEVHELGVYSVVVGNTNGCYAASPYYGFGIPIQEEEVIDRNQVAVYPNPTSNDLFIEFRDGDPEHDIVIIDNLSQPVIELTTDKSVQKIDLSGLASGSYQVRIISQTTNENIPIIKQ